MMKDAMLYLIAALIFTFFLGFIDEGYYSLKTFENFWNWIVLGGYLLVFWCAELLLDSALNYLFTIDKVHRRTLSVMMGLFLPTIFILWVAGR